MNATAKPRLRTRIRPYAGAPSENAGEGGPPDQAQRGLAPAGIADTGEPAETVHAPKPGDAANDAVGDRVVAPTEPALAATQATLSPAPNAAQDDYEVGYGRPPKASQFKPGQSGNPKGRRRGARNHWIILNELLREQIPYTEDGKRKSAPADELILRRLRNKALKGEDRAIVTLFSKIEAHEREARAAVGAARADGPMPEDDKAILARFIARAIEAARLQDTPETAAEDDDAAPSQPEENE